MRLPKAGDIVACDWATAVVLSTMQTERCPKCGFWVRILIVASKYQGPCNSEDWWRWHTLNEYCGAPWSVVDDGPALEWLLDSAEKVKIILAQDESGAHSGPVEKDSHDC